MVVQYHGEGIGHLCGSFVDQERMETKANNLDEIEESDEEEEEEEALDNYELLDDWEGQDAASDDGGEVEYNDGDEEEGYWSDGYENDVGEGKYKSEEDMSPVHLEY